MLQLWKFTLIATYWPMFYQLLKMNATGQRWVNELTDSNLNIHYNPGRNNVNEDYLSRIQQDKREYTYRSSKKEMREILSNTSAKTDSTQPALSY